MTKLQCDCCTITRVRGWSPSPDDQVEVGSAVQVPERPFDEVRCNRGIALAYVTPEAITTLSDAAFKLFAWLCLNADRHTGRIRISVAEMAQALGKGESPIQAACDELVERSVCRDCTDGQFEVTDRYWPYEKQSCESGPEKYVADVRRLLSEQACVRCRFTAADERRASRSLSARRFAAPGRTRHLVGMRSQIHDAPVQPGRGHADCQLGLLHRGDRRGRQ